MLDSERREKLLLTFKNDRKLAHLTLFPQRHKDIAPEFHDEIIALLNSDDPLVALMAFRGGAKSTLLEEYVLLAVLFREFNFPLLVGPNLESACERLAPIRLELETNDALIELFGDQVSSPWSNDELQLANGARIKAIGAGQSMRGKKKKDSDRPDLAAIDDLEDEENIRTPEAIRKTERWLSGTLRPALHPTRGKIRFIGTPIHPKALIKKKCEDPKWKSRKFPIINRDLETGEEKSAWESRFPLKWIRDLREEYAKDGNLIEFNQEYMCEAEDIAGKPFQAKMIKVEAQPKIFTPKYSFVDPARSVKKTSARTGYVTFSWFGEKLIVHEAEGHFHKPDEIVNYIANNDRVHSPIQIGVEADGLEEFLMQPLRTRSKTDGTSLPVAPYHAPNDKDRFIEGLQPFYMAGLVIHAKPLPDLEVELTQFPTGRKDVLNALAYALRMRPGRPVYEDFNNSHIAPVLEIDPVMPRYLVVSSRPSMTAAALVQYSDGVLRIYHDWVRNEPPQEALENIVREAILIGGQVKLSAPLEQFDKYTNYGLPAAAKTKQFTIQKTAPAISSEGRLGDWLRKQVRGMPAVLVSERARWTINGLAGGYCRKLEKGGKLADHPTDNQYRLVLEAIESFVSWFDGNKTDDNLSPRRYARTNDGRTFLTSLPR